MKLLICIDDTDNLDSIGTGQLLENLCAELEARGLAKGGFVTRHQLLIHEDIDYTSHNSSMCCALETEDAAAVTEAAKAYLEANAAPGSDPGLCILQLRSGEHYDRLTEFGRRAQTEVLQKADAYAAAAHFRKRCPSPSTAAPATASSARWPASVCGFPARTEASRESCGRRPMGKC